MPELATHPALAATLGRHPQGAVVDSVSIALPSERRQSVDVAARLGVGEDWILTRTGVRERRVAGKSQRVYALAAEAAAKALLRADVDPLEVDLVLVATMSHDQLTPSCAALVAAEIGSIGAGAIDVNAACAGFVSALDLAVSQVESGRAHTVVVIGAEIMLPLIDPDDRGTAAIFGDGAGAVVVRATEAPGAVGPTVLGSDGRHAGLVRSDREGPLRMKGHDTFREAVDRLSQVTLEAIGAAGLGIEDIDLFAYHQANKRILQAVGERLELPAEKVVDCVAKYGNTSAASVPIALHEAEQTGMLGPGSRVLLAAFGGGLSWGATTLVWGMGDA